MADDGVIQVFEDGDGFLFFGSRGQLELLPSGPGFVGEDISAANVAKLGVLMSGFAEAQSMSGRWLKLTQESSSMVKLWGPARSKAEGLMTGVVRQPNGQIVKHLRFENVGLLSPAAPAVLGAMATQYALQAALDEITDYLAVIDAKLDRLLKQRQTQTLGQLGGVVLALDEADAIHQQTGLVSDVTWSKVQTNSLALQTMQAEALAQLHEVAEQIGAAHKDLDRAARVVDSSQQEVSFWLGVLARTIALQDRQYVLELARVADVDASQLEPHREGMRIARSARALKIGEILAGIADSIRDASSISNFARVANPINSQRVVRGGNALNDQLSDFARHADLAALSTERLESLGWGAAARALVGDAAGKVAATGGDVAGKAMTWAQGVEESHDRAVMRSAEKIREKQRRRDEPGELGEASSDGS